MREYRENGFPITIVRPSHTYDQTLLPFRGGYTMLHRLRAGKPIIIHGDGTSLWVMTHHRDFAKAFVGMLGRSQAIGETYHITSDEVLTWNQIARTMAEAAGAAPNFVHVSRLHGNPVLDEIRCVSVNTALIDQHIHNDTSDGNAKFIEPINKPFDDCYWQSLGKRHKEKRGEFCIR